MVTKENEEIKFINKLYQKHALATQKPLWKHSTHQPRSLLPTPVTVFVKRPPMQNRLSLPVIHGPSSCAYDVPDNPPSMKTAPSYTFRVKTHLDRVGGYDDVWFNKSSQKDLNRPSPADYDIKGIIGSQCPSYRQSAVHTMAGRMEFSLFKKDAPNEPSPNTYNLCLHNRIKILKRNSTLKTMPRGLVSAQLWLPNDHVPGPGSYNGRSTFKSKVNGYSFTKSPRCFDYQTTKHTL